MLFFCGGQGPKEEQLTKNNATFNLPRVFNRKAIKTKVRRKIVVQKLSNLAGEPITFLRSAFKWMRPHISNDSLGSRRANRKDALPCIVKVLFGKLAKSLPLFKRFQNKKKNLARFIEKISSNCSALVFTPSPYLLHFCQYINFPFLINYKLNVLAFIAF